jgi:hypothetical protein
LRERKGQSTGVWQALAERSPKNGGVELCETEGGGRSKIRKSKIQKPNPKEVSNPNNQDELRTRRFFGN